MCCKHLSCFILQNNISKNIIDSSLYLSLALSIPSTGHIGSTKQSTSCIKHEQSGWELIMLGICVIHVTDITWDKAFFVAVVAKISILRWMCSHTKNDHIQNDCIQGNIKVSGSSGEESRSHVFFHIKKGKGKTRKTLDEIIKRDLEVNNILENLVFN